MQVHVEHTHTSTCPFTSFLFSNFLPPLFKSFKEPLLHSHFPHHTFLLHPPHFFLISNFDNIPSPMLLTLTLCKQAEHSSEKGYKWSMYKGCESGQDDSWRVVEKDAFILSVIWVLGETICISKKTR